MSATSAAAAAAAANSTPMTNTRSYDPNIIIRAANEKLASGDLAGGQTLFQSALLNWVDDAREGTENTMDADSLKEAIATLWIAYCHFLMSAKQFKSATEAFEQAVECPLGGTVGRVWLEYARFLEERGKVRTAQQVFLRALVSNGNTTSGAVQDEQDRNLLWNEFLELSRNTTENPDLTLKELELAIQEEHGQQDEETGPASKRPRLGSSSVVKQEMFGDNDEYGDGGDEDGGGPPIRTHVVTPSDVDLEIETLTEAIQNVPNDPTFMAAWLVRDGDAPPQPPVPLFEAAPPKLSDPTGKDLLGEELALAVVSRLLQPSGGVVLQVCRGLWMWTLLKEQQSQKARNRMDESIMKEYKMLQARLDERLSVAGPAEAAVRMMNQQELQAFETKAQEERRELWNTLAWEARQLLWASQQVLNKMQMPGFVSNQNNMAGTTVDDNEVQGQICVCAYLHSAFFLRKRIGEKAHMTMLQSQQERLKQYVAQLHEQQQQAASNHQLLQSPPPLPYGGGMLPPPPPPQPTMISYPGYPQQQQHPPMGAAYPPLAPQYPPPPNYGNNPQQRW
jgi:tetratricopeptide (TPR) repeat protein